MPFYYDSLEEVPESERSEYTESEFEGKQVYQHKQVVSLARALASEKEAKQGIKSKFDEYEKQEADRLTQAEQRAYEKAIKEGRTEEVERLLKQKLADAENRASEQESQYKQRLQAIADQKRDAIAAELTAHAKPTAKPAFERLVKSIIHVDPETFEETFLDDAGNATSLKKSEVLTGLLAKSDVFKALLPADPTATGAGLVNGSKGGNATSKQPNEYTEAERVALYRTDPVRFRQLFNTN